MEENPKPLPPAIAKLRLFILGTYYLLLAYFLLQNLVSSGGAVLASLLVSLIQVIPLLLFLRGLHRSHLRTYAWLSFAILLYFIHGVMLAFIPQRMLWGIAEVTLCVMLFTGLVLFIRQYRRHFGVSL